MYCKKGITEHLDKTISLIYDVWLPQNNYKIDNIGFDMIIVSDEDNFWKAGKEAIIEIYIPISVE